jgi:hypothetical protein
MHGRILYKFYCMRSNAPRRINQVLEALWPDLLDAVAHVIDRDDLEHQLIVHLGGAYSQTGRGSEHVCACTSHIDASVRVTAFACMCACISMHV